MLKYRFKNCYKSDRTFPGSAEQTLTNPALDHVGLPDELKEGRVVNEPGLAVVSRLPQRVQLLLQQATSLLNGRGIVVALAT